jgi:hypothetical protein
LSPLTRAFGGGSRVARAVSYISGIKLGDMSSITVTTQAGIHNKSHSHNYPKGEGADATTMIVVGAICAVLLIRGVIKTFR